MCNTRSTFEHPDETFTTYVSRQMEHLKHTHETLAKTPENIRKAIAKYMQHPDKTLATSV
jgi:hypothetical protein